MPANTTWLDPDRRREIRRSLALRRRITPTWLERAREDRWLAHDGLRRIADDLRERRSAAAGDRRDPPVQP
jgi:hypothetical protein